MTRSGELGTWAVEVIEETPHTIVAMAIRAAENEGREAPGTYADALQSMIAGNLSLEGWWSLIHEARQQLNQQPHEDQS